jgi:hypothetical protein
MTTEAPAAKKASAKKKAPAKKAARAKATPAPEAPADAPAPKAAVKFREMKDWPDCKDQKILVWHPALGMGPELNGYHKAKVLSVNINTGSLLVAIATDKIKGRYLLPLDSAAGRVR